MKVVAISLLLLAAVPASAQTPDASHVMKAVRSALAPALPFPATVEDGSVAENNNTEAPWMVGTDQNNQTISIFANPLNEAVQLRAARAMAQIEDNIQAAQRRATAQYEAAVAEAKRTGRSQAVDGVTLNDEGLAGERIDVESQATIFVDFNAREYRFLIPGSMEPARVETFPHPNSVVLMTPAHSYKDADGFEHYAGSHRVVLLGRNLEHKVTKQKDGQYLVTVVPTTPATGGLDSLTLHVHGNSELVGVILARANWTRLLELLK